MPDLFRNITQFLHLGLMDENFGTPPMLSFLALFLVAVLFAYIFIWVKTRRAAKLLASLPCLPTLPFLGNVHQIFGSNRHLYGVLETMSKILEDYQRPFLFWAGPQPVVVVGAPDDIKAVTTAFLDKPYYYKFAQEWVGNGLITASGPIWKHNIKKLAGTFTTSVVDGYQGVFNDQAEKLVQKLSTEVDGPPFDVLHKYLSPTTLEAICQTALCVPQFSHNIVTKEYYHAFIRTFELLIKRGMNILYHIEFIYHFTPSYKEFKSCIAVMHSFCQNILINRKREREEMKKNGESPEKYSGDEGVKFKAFVDILLDLSELDPTFTEEQIRCEIDTIIIGGHETTAITLFVTLVMIGCKPEVQTKMFEELHEIFGNSNRPIEKEDLQRMKYCEAVIFETLRMYPPIPFYLRNADKDLQLKSCTIPKGSVCGIHAWSAGRSVHVWGSDAKLYKPARWLEEQTGYPQGFLAFSSGRRSCIGKRYAIPLLKTVIASVVREYEIISDGDNLKFKIDVGLMPDTGHLIQVKKRK